jgi:hypothetical protein
MKKRAVQLSTQTMILIILGLIVLVVLIFIFRGQVSKGAKQYFDIGEQAAGEADIEKCSGGLIVERKCATNCKDLEKDSVYFYYAIGKKNCDEGYVCCERGEVNPAKKAAK